MKPHARRSRGVDVRSLLFMVAAFLYITVMLRQFSIVQQPTVGDAPSDDGQAIDALSKTIAPQALPTFRTEGEKPVDVVTQPAAVVIQTPKPEVKAPVAAATTIVQTPNEDINAPAQAVVKTVEAPALPPPSQVIRGRRTMVLLANYRDSKRCGETLTSMFTNAVEPDLLRVSIHDQIDEASGDLQCVDSYCQLVGERNCRRSQIVSTKIKAIDAKGPIVARYITEKQIRDEEFCLGIDSHLVFMPKWDESVVQQWEDTENENAIITVYPKVTQYITDHSKDNYMGLMCLARIEQPEADAMIQYRGVRWIRKTNTTKPRLQSQYAGGFNFGSCRAYTEVPNDPYMPILFFGEEYVRGARLWTAGFDFYAPSVDAVYHWYEMRKRVWDEDWSRRYQMLQKSKRRARAIMGLPTSSQDYDKTDIEKYGLGTKRTFEQWKQFTGFDPLTPWTDKTQDQFDNCGELKLVPYNK